MSHKHRLIIVLLLLVNNMLLNAQVTADFTVSATEGCGSLTATFTDLSGSSNGAITAWDWDIAGTTFNVQNPSFTFSTPGIYTICLTVSDMNGNTATECKDDFINVYTDPIPDYSVTPSVGCPPLNVTFTDLTDSPDAPIVRWTWDIGGEAGVLEYDNNSVPPSIENTYNLPGNYSVLLLVEDANGCTSFISENDVIEVTPAPEIVVTLSDSITCTPPLDISFTNNSPTTAGITFNWDFGVTTFEGLNPPTITYTDAGIYSVTVIAEYEATGCADTLVLENAISVGSVVDFSFSPENGCVGEGIDFTDNSPAPADSVRWDFGDGIIGIGANPTHVYDSPGCYTVGLTRYVAGCPASDISPVCINIYDLPAISYSNDNALGCSVPHEVNFTSDAPDAVSWEWDFGDGNTSTEENPTHIYTELGSHNVSLTITDAQGCMNTISTTTIELQAIEAVLDDPEYSGCVPLTFTAFENSISPAPISFWQWQLNTPSGNVVSTESTPEFTVTDVGEFDLTLIVTNVLGCVDTTVFEDVIIVGDIIPVNFEAEPLVACVEEPIQFTNLSGDQPGTWYWEFDEDGEIDSNEQNPEFEFDDFGFFDVTLVYVHNGCLSDTTIDNYIHITEPVAGFNYEIDCNNTFVVNFTDQSAGSTFLSWDFGVNGTDADTSTIASPSYVFSAPGTYNVTQTVFNSSTNCTHSSTKEVIITEPQADFAVVPEFGCFPLTVAIENNSQDAVAYEWTAPGGEISDSSIVEPTITYADPGTYEDIQLIITDVNECTDTLVYPNPILVNDIEVDWIISTTGGCAPLTVNFTDQSTNLHANNVQWDWVFDDGLGSASGQNVSFTFDQVGEYKLTLTVTDEWGCTKTRNWNPAIIVTAPEAAFEVTPLGCTADSIQFTNLSTGDGLTYLWNFDDGTTSTEENPAHLFSAVGDYNVCLTITDEAGCANTTCSDEPVSIANPVSDFEVDVAFSSCPPLLVSFENLSLNATDYLWDFGDGTGLSEQTNPLHVYTEPGAYTVTLIAYSSDLCQDTLVLNNLIELEGPIGEYSFDVDPTCAPTNVNFSASSNDSYTYVWDFGDGSPLDSTFNVDSDLQQHLYTSAGNYIPRLILIDEFGCSRTLEAVDTIDVHSLSIDFMASDSILCDIDSSLTFVNIINSSDPIVDFEWTFENGTPATSTDENPTVAFNGPGLYDVSLTVSTAFCTETIVKNDYIRIGAVPEADFSVSATDGCAPLDISFTDNSTIIGGAISTVQWNFGDTFTAFGSDVNHTYTQGGTYDVELTATTAVGCVDVATETITVYPQLAISAGVYGDLCIGESVQLEGLIGSDTTGVTFYWESDPSLSCTNCLDPIASPTDTVTYTFVAISVDGCVSMSDVTINVGPYEVPVVSLSPDPDTTICATEFVQLFVSGGNDVFDYQWDASRPGLDCYDFCINPIASPLVTTTYVVSVTNDFGCTAVDSLRVNVLNQFEDITGEDPTICEDASTTLGVTMGSNVNWWPSNGLSCVECPNPTASPNETTTYTVTAITDDGCEISDSVTVTVLFADDIDAGDSTAICIGESIILTGFSPLSGPTEIISWSPTATLDDPTSSIPTASPTQATTYYMSVTTDECTLVDSVFIDIIEKADISASDITVCNGEEAQLQATGYADTYTWFEASTLSDLSIPNPIATADSTTTYYVVGSLSTCEPDTAEATVFVDPLPEFNTPMVRYFSPGQEVLLDVEYDEDGLYEFYWSPSTGLSCSACFNPIAVVDTTTTYTLTVIDVTTGCVDSTFVTLEYLGECFDDLVQVPNIFTPNDDTHNDLLMIQHSSAIQRIKTFYIFDRWGGMVFQTTDINQGWDGKYRGQTAPDGVYVYYLEAYCETTGDLIVKKGDLTLFR